MVRVPPRGMRWRRMQQSRRAHSWSPGRTIVACACAQASRSIASAWLPGLSLGRRRVPAGVCAESVRHAFAARRAGWGWGAKGASAVFRRVRSAATCATRRLPYGLTFVLPLFWQSALLRARLSSFLSGFAVAGGLCMYQLRSDVWASHEILEGRINAQGSEGESLGKRVQVLEEELSAMKAAAAAMEKAKAGEGAAAGDTTAASA